MSDDFAYVNARIRGMRGELLGTALLSQLASLRDLREVLQRLRETPYGAALQSALVGSPTIEGIEEGLGAHLEQCYSQLLRISSGKSEALIGLALRSWENRCLKALLRGKIRHEGPEAILAACLPAGFFDGASLRELVRQDDAGHIIDLLRLWGFEPARHLQKAWRSRTPGEEIQRLELALDRDYAAGVERRLEMIGSAGEGLREFLRLEVDVMNLLTVLRLLHARSPAEVTASFFIPGGRLVSWEFFERLSQEKDVQRALGSITSSPLGPVFLGALSEFDSTGRLSVVEKAAQRHLLAEAMRMAIRDPLGPGLAVGYIWAKADEVARLRVICRALHVGLQPIDLGGEISPAVR